MLPIITCLMKRPIPSVHVRNSASYLSPHPILLLLAALIIPFTAGTATAQGLTLANPHWNIMLSDFGSTRIV
jgi:hypothetical protein